MATTHLRALQALEMAVRKGSLSEAAAELSITPAALGQRIRILEDFLELELIVRGRKGTRPTQELEDVLADLQMAFTCLERVTKGLNFQKASAIHIVAEPEIAELWLKPRLPEFRKTQPNIQFCINGEGDVPSRVGSPDILIERNNENEGEILFRDHFVPVSSPDNMWRLGRHDPVDIMEGIGLIHVHARAGLPPWESWFKIFGKRRSGWDRGQMFRSTKLALEATRNAIAFMLCGLSLLERDLCEGTLVLLFPPSMGLPAAAPYRVRTRKTLARRPQLQSFVDWLHDEGKRTQAFIDQQIGVEGGPTATADLGKSRI